MHLYRLHKMKEGGTSAGFEWFAGKAGAERAGREWSGAEGADYEVERIHFIPTKASVKHLLELVASHPDNG